MGWRRGRRKLRRDPPTVYQGWFQSYELVPGDSVAFDSSTPHRLFNKGDVPVHAIWFVVGRESDQ